MRLTRILLTALMIVALLSTLILSAYAEGQGNDRFNNPGKGHDWALYPGESYGNSNTENHDGNNHNEENGYKNHLPLINNNPY